MTINPNSEVKILSGCRLKPDYKHSIWWTDEAAQYSYFSSLVKHTVNASQYQRSGDNSIKVPIPIEQLMNCNYLMFTNKGHENKRYYAFITNIKYVGEVTTLVEYEIDLIQTWYFECTLMPCLVEREHSATDEIGENLLPESVAIGDYVTYEAGHLDERLYEKCIVVASTFKRDNDGIDIRGGEMYGSIYSGLFFSAFPCTEEGIRAVQAMITLDGIVPATDIVSIFMAPKFCVDETAGIASVEKCYEPFGTYTPKNNKLFTYPYNYLQVTAGPGTGKEFKYELFNSDMAQFYIRGDMSCDPGVYLRPTNYKTEGSDISQNDITESMMLTGFPQCPWCSDMYLAFLSQVASTTVSIGHTVMSGMGLNLTPVYRIRSLYPSYVESDFGRAVNVMNSLTDNIRPEQNVSNSSSAGSWFNAGELTYKYAKKRITEYYARMIDMFFDMYGYATNRVKIPDRTSRPNWNYVKTVDCCINATIPTDIVTKIQNIYNNGITFWRWGDNIGDYDLNNKPVKKEANNG